MLSIGMDYYNSISTVAVLVFSSSHTQNLKKEKKILSLKLLLVFPRYRRTRAHILSDEIAKVLKSN